jgi:nitroreductase
MTSTADSLAAPPAKRVANALVDSQFVERWSPRSLLSDPIDATSIATLFEAARWAPSASNLQPWLFVYADGEELLARFRPIVRDGNRRWADQAHVLAVVFARLNNPKTGEPNRLAVFDAGAAWTAFITTRLTTSWGFPERSSSAYAPSPSADWGRRTSSPKT